MTAPSFPDLDTLIATLQHLRAEHGPLPVVLDHPLLIFGPVDSVEVVTEHCVEPFTGPVILFRCSQEG